MLKTCLAALLCLVAASSRVHADDADIDVRAFEYVDVVETSDGSIWKGVLVEQTPNVEYRIATADGSLHVIKAADVVKISKQKNRDYRAPVAVATVATARPEGVATSYEPRRGLPRPLATSGLRIATSGALVFPTGDIKSMGASYSPDVRLGYEVLFGNFGIGGGGLARFTYWQLPGTTNDANWTLETHAYGRAAFHISRAALFGGVSLGVDTNYEWTSRLDMAKTTLGLGVNLETGVEVAALPSLAFQLAFDYHPPTDIIVDGAPQSISYYALLVGGLLRL